ncbi:GTP pyrophosphokinase [Oligella ureolytica]|uniref:GTP pyrophosphokinase n=1 Tax=Oligella ureolytica TaxID=90244 RepID=A0A378XHV1_9BURK|nr:bifunctional (p)ppGpp synthetase/guanosine-3',5'-bis(diphosphate) 3'-pyrophosphohydrolase [Oligella ureolytica]QPT39769.1 bifunctional (p)ppGpp synthetase/guanosine-3',5'-bis(diphosphate) 3'-pyrophosphohydrolase [Oligella ureolytica]SUA52198.1 GTP pyrophosphokinase [Oligella ureolytica]SUA57491.1 GTP pyrophosphokinase [Oligella ureolytica]
MIKKVLAGEDEHHFSESWLAPIYQDLGEKDAAKLQLAIEWAEKRLSGVEMFTAEPCVRHAKGVLHSLSLLQMDVTSMIAGILAVLPSSEDPKVSHDTRQEILDLFGLEVLNLVQGTRTLIRVGAQATLAENTDSDSVQDQQEMLRKMLLALATDLRIVILRLASRLQTLRWYSESKRQCPVILAQQTRDIYAPLANRLGIWQIKWELEDLSLRFLEPEIYRDIAKKLEVRRTERESMVEDFIAKLKKNLHQLNVKADVSGRAKHIYSIYNKMRNKNLSFEEIYDLHAIRIVTGTERDCYTALSMAHSLWTPVMNEFDDYIARPKPNGYRSLHTVVQDEHGRNFEVQIRTHEMHEFAEYGMAAHWRYKESGAKGGETSASSLYDRQISWMRQLLSWRREEGLSEQEASQLQEEILGASTGEFALEESAEGHLIKDKESIPGKPVDQKNFSRIYVLTPQARVIELPEGSTPVDFAYRLHTDLGHRCRGAKVDGNMVALNTPLQTGQTVEIIAAKSGGPSRDWLNTQLGYLASPRARAKVRLWFNAVELQQRISTGQDLVEKELQRLGKTATNLEQLAQKLGFSHAEDLYVSAAKEEFSLRNIAQAFVEQEEPSPDKEVLSRQHQSQINTDSKNGVLVVGVDSLLTQLAGCCHPAPPDKIHGFITRGRGVTIHREGCPSIKALELKHPERIIEVDWGNTEDRLYPINISVSALDRPGLIRDITELFSKHKINVAGLNTQSRQGKANLLYTVEVRGGSDVRKVISAISELPEVHSVNRS